MHRNQHVWTEEPGLHVPASKPGRGRPPKTQKPATTSITVEKLAKGTPQQDWTRCILRDCTRGELRVDIATRRIWAWDGKEERARCWHLIVRRGVGSVNTVKYSFSNAPRRYAAAPSAPDAGATLLGRARFRRRQGRVRPSRLSSAGMEVMASPLTMVILAMLFFLRQRLGPANVTLSN